MIKDLKRLKGSGGAKEWRGLVHYRDHAVVGRGGGGDAKPLCESTRAFDEEEGDEEGREKVEGKEGEGEGDEEEGDEEGREKAEGEEEEGGKKAEEDEDEGRKKADEDEGDGDEEDLSCLGMGSDVMNMKGLQQLVVLLGEFVEFTYIEVSVCGSREVVRKGVVAGGCLERVAHDVVIGTTSDGDKPTFPSAYVMNTRGGTERCCYLVDMVQRAWFQVALWEDTGTLDDLKKRLNELSGGRPGMGQVRPIVEGGGGDSGEPLAGLEEAAGSQEATWAGRARAAADAATREAEAAGAGGGPSVAFKYDMFCGLPGAARMRFWGVRRIRWCCVHLRDLH